jgi:hypothetical protein
MTNPIINFTTLVSGVRQFFEDDGTEFTAYIPIAVDLAEQRLTRELDSTHLRVNTNVSCAAGGNLITKPSGYRFGFNLRYVTPDGELKTLFKSTDSFCEDYWPYGTTSVGAPKYYSDYSATQFLIVPTCSNAGDFRLSYTGRPQALTADVSTNVFTETFPDMLYYATLIEQAKFAKKYSMVQTLEANYQICLRDVVNEGRRERRDSGLEPSNTQGNQNTLNANIQPE